MSNQYLNNRLGHQRKIWRKNHPYLFVAKPQQNTDGTINLKRWKCMIPGPKDTEWQNCPISFKLDFLNTYPNQPPRCKFLPVPPHPNIYPNGLICLSTLAEKWQPSFTITQIIVNIHNFFGLKPNTQSPANPKIADIYLTDLVKYKEMIAQYKKNVQSK